MLFFSLSGGFHDGNIWLPVVNMCVTTVLPVITFTNNMVKANIGIMDVDLRQFMPELRV